jgi:hypothetical protein
LNIFISYFLPSKPVTKEEKNKKKAISHNLSLVGRDRRAMA